MLTTLKKDRHDNLRITSRRHTDEPAVIFVLVAFSLSLSEFVTHDLGAARFSGKINPLQVRAAGGPNYAAYVRGTDGSPAVRLSEGLANSISPDNR